jgi:hypothetical protein
MRKTWLNTIVKWLNGMLDKVNSEVYSCSNQAHFGMACGFLYPSLESGLGMQKILQSVSN